MFYFSDEELLMLPRNSSARHGRRAVSSLGTRSAGSSPRKSSQRLSSLGGEDWEDIIMPSNIINQQKPFLELDIPGQQFSSRNSRSASTNSREGKEPSLEESWSSLSFFNRRHKGRLTEKAEGEYMPHFSCRIAALIHQWIASFPQNYLKFCSIYKSDFILNVFCYGLINSVICTFYFN
jgi:hypothetical protein